MDFFNSQQLSPLDGFYRIFEVVNNFLWGVGNVGSYSIQVSKSSAKPQQRDITLMMDSLSGMYVPKRDSDKNLSINQNDYVLWHIESTDPHAPPFSIVGNQADLLNHAPVFRSTSLTDHEAVSHLFFAPGTYGYTVNGGASGPQTGTIVVSPPPSPRDPQAFLIAIDDSKQPNPPTIPKSGDGPIYPGDAVHWDIEKSSGCVIKFST